MLGLQILVKFNSNIFRSTRTAGRVHYICSEDFGFIDVLSKTVHRM